MRKTSSLLCSILFAGAFILGIFTMAPYLALAGEWEGQDLPQVGRGLTGIWGTAPDNVYAVGSRDGVILHYDGSQWSQMENSARSSLHCIWGSDADNIFAVGRNGHGTILHFDGNSWIEQESPLPANYPPSELYGITGLNGNDVFAVGTYPHNEGIEVDNSIILRHNSGRWFPMTDPTRNGLYGIAEVAGKLYAVGDKGTIIVYDEGQGWTVMESGINIFLTSVWGSDAGNIFAVGGQGTILRYDGNNWTAMQSGTSEPLWHVWGTSSENVYVTGSANTLLHYDGAGWTALELEGVTGVGSIWGDAADNVFIVDGYETILHFNGTEWSRMEGISKLHLTGVWPSSPHNAFAVGTISRTLDPHGAIFQFNGLEWSLNKTLFNDFPKAVWAHTDTDVYAVGVGKGGDGNPYGIVLHYDGDKWEKMETPRVNPLFAVWGSSSDNIFAVGSEGSIIHYDGNSWSAMESGIFLSLHGVWGSSATDVFAVGAGTILHYDGQNWVTVNSPTQRTLFDVWGSSANNIIAAGEQGTVLRFDGENWQIMTEEFSTDFSSVWTAGPDDIYLAGEEGIIRHYNGSSWLLEDSGTTNLLHCVRGVQLDALGHHVFAAGVNRTMLRSRYYSYIPQAGTVQLPKTGQTTSYAPGDDGDLQRGLPWPNPRFSGNNDGTVTDNLTGLMWLKDGACLGRKSWYEAMDTITSFNTSPAQFSCTDYTAEYSDWRLPNAVEMESLVNLEYCASGDWLNELGAFANVQHRYWSSTTFAYNPGYCWDGGIGGFWDVGFEVWVMCNGGITSVRKDYSGDPQYYQIPAVLAVRGESTGPARLWKTGQNEIHAPHDDGAYQAGTAWPDPRFTDNQDGTVTDSLTGLMWLQDPRCFGRQTWDNALVQVSQFNADDAQYGCEGYLAKYNDWRLANRKELQSLLDFSTSNMALPPGYKDVFPRLKHGFDHFWSSSTLHHCAGENAFSFEPYAQIRGGRIIGFWEKTELFEVWPVRGNPTLFVAPGSHDFGTIQANMTSEPFVVTITNRSAQELDVISMELSDPQNFELNANGGPNPCGSNTPSIAPDGNCTVEVSFTPKQSGNYAETFSLRFSGESEQHYSVALQGYSPYQSGGPCFIFKAVQGTPLEKDLHVLREFRDRYLLPHPLGKHLVGLYYAVSPLLAEKMAEQPFLQTLTRRVVATLLNVIDYKSAADQSLPEGHD